MVSNPSKLVIGVFASILSFLANAGGTHSGGGGTLPLKNILDGIMYRTSAPPETVFPDSPFPFVGENEWCQAFVKAGSEAFHGLLIRGVNPGADGTPESSSEYFSSPQVLLSSQEARRLDEVLSGLCESGNFHLASNLSNSAHQKLIARNDPDAGTIEFDPSQMEPRAILSKFSCDSNYAVNVDRETRCLKNVFRSIALHEALSLLGIEGDGKYPVSRNLIYVMTHPDLMEAHWRVIRNRYGKLRDSAWTRWVRRYAFTNEKAWQELLSDAQALDDMLGPNFRDSYSPGGVLEDIAREVKERFGS